MTRSVPTARLVIAAAAMTMALLAMVGMKQYTLATGQTVQLETWPIDPQALFRGDDVLFRYKISLLDLQRLPGDKDFNAGDIVYVVLKPGKPYWTPESVHRTMPATKPGEAVIKGRVTYHWRRRGYGNIPSRNELDVTYGIEDYSIPARQAGGSLDPDMLGPISVLAAVDRFGNAAISRILVNGKPRFTETMF